MIGGLLRQPDSFMVALHESGHAIAALVLRQPLIGVVLPDGRHRRGQPGGAALFGRGTVTEMAKLEELDIDMDAKVTAAPGDLRAHLIVLAAGAAAEARAGYQPTDSDWYDAVDAGNLAAKALRVPCYHADVRRLLRRCEAEATTIIGNTWPWIVRTAQALEIRRRLTADEIRNLKHEGKSA